MSAVVFARETNLWFEDFSDGADGIVCRPDESVCQQLFDTAEIFTRWLVFHMDTVMQQHITASRVTWTSSLIVFAGRRLREGYPENTL